MSGILPEPHPLSGRRVVLDRDLATGAVITVLDWWERAPGLCPGESGRVVVQAEGRLRAVRADALPDYGPMACGANP